MCRVEGCGDVRDVLLCPVSENAQVNRPSSHYEYMSLDDFEELLADKPADEKWEPLGGRVVRMMAGARWEHNRIDRDVIAPAS